jgi:tRNA threonylcarbamoyladenosine biosynthesis protein TsaB
MLLAIDTSTEQASIALFDGNRLTEAAWPAGRDQTVSVLSEIDHLFQLAGVELSQIDTIAVAIGPGSFSGLRVGISVAKGFVLGTDARLMGVSTLDAIAEPLAPLGLPIIAVVPAGRRRVLFAQYRPDEESLIPVTGVANGTIEDLVRMVSEQMDQTIVAGELSETHRATLAAVSEHVVLASPSAPARAAVIARVGWRRRGRADFDDPVALEPVYVHGTAAPVTRSN